MGLVVPRGIDTHFGCSVGSSISDEETLLEIRLYMEIGFVFSASDAEISLEMRLETELRHG